MFSYRLGLLRSLAHETTSRARGVGISGRGGAPNSGGSRGLELLGQVNHGESAGNWVIFGGFQSFEALNSGRYWGTWGYCEVK